MTVPANAPYLSARLNFVKLNKGRFSRWVELHRKGPGSSHPYFGAFGPQVTRGLSRVYTSCGETSSRSTYFLGKHKSKDLSASAHRAVCSGGDYKLTVLHNIKSSDNTQVNAGPQGQIRLLC